MTPKTRKYLGIGAAVIAAIIVLQLLNMLFKTAE